uniref:Lipase domain-containing protein n=1 Tax=Biomphalaria glabrata TaxID=6526 RepID=A0A2C9L887_BIOGL
MSRTDQNNHGSVSKLAALDLKDLCLPVGTYQTDQTSWNLYNYVYGKIQEVVNATLGSTKTCCKSDLLPKGCECYEIFSNTMFYKPQCPTSIRITFYLYTRQHRAAPQWIQAGESFIKGTSYSGNKKTIFIAHGFTDNGGSQWIIEMINALLNAEDVNVIVVDWGEGAKGPYYLQAAANTRIVGSMVGQLIQDMHVFSHASYATFHLIGHSLGAHLLGYAGKEVFRLTNQKVGRISGLDPAGPAFEQESSFTRIDSSDAKFVDIVHTDAEPLIKGGFGIQSSVGHVDFYVNGGVHQPGCPEEGFLLINFLLVYQITVKDFKEGIACSHRRAVELFTNSISTCRYNPPGGNSACTMGYHVSRSCKGDHRPVTTSRAPYC